MSSASNERRRALKLVVAGRIAEAVACALIALSQTSCANSGLDAILIHPNARDVQRHEYPLSKSRQTSYRVELKYPETAVSASAFFKLKALGWAKCSTPQEGWNSLVDASRGEEHKETVFQNMSYWKNNNALLSIVMRYSAGVDKAGHQLEAPKMPTSGYWLSKPTAPTSNSGSVSSAHKLMEQQQLRL